MPSRGLRGVTDRRRPAKHRFGQIVAVDDLSGMGSAAGSDRLARLLNCVGYARYKYSLEHLPILIPLHPHAHSSPNMILTFSILITAATALAAPHLHDTHLVSRALAPGFDAAAVTLSPANNPNLVGTTVRPPWESLRLTPTHSADSIVPRHARPAGQRRGALPHLVRYLGDVLGRMGHPAGQQRQRQAERDQVGRRGLIRYQVVPWFPLTSQLLSRRGTSAEEQRPGKALHLLPGPSAAVSAIRRSKPAPLTRH